MRRSFIIFTSCHQPDEFSDEILFSFASSMESTSRISAISVSFFAPLKLREAIDLPFLGVAYIVAESDSFTAVPDTFVSSTSLAVALVTTVDLSSFRYLLRVLEWRLAFAAS